MTYTGDLESRVTEGLMCEVVFNTVSTVQMCVSFRSILYSGPYPRHAAAAQSTLSSSHNRGAGTCLGLDFGRGGRGGGPGRAQRPVHPVPRPHSLPPRGHAVPRLHPRGPGSSARGDPRRPGLESGERAAAGSYRHR